MNNNNIELSNIITNNNIIIELLDITIKYE